MIPKAKHSIRVDNLLIEAIQPTLGLKKGCNLSPLLFNLFVDDLNLEFNQECDQVNFFAGN